MLLSVDLGVRTGVAVFDRDGRLVRYASHNFGSVGRLKRALRPIVAGVEDLSDVFLEGDQTLARHWSRVAEHLGATTHTVSAEVWRDRLLIPRERRSGSEAKRHAGALALKVIEASGAKKPTAPIKHDAAEAILIGVYGALELGWLKRAPFA